MSVAWLSAPPSSLVMVMRAVRLTISDVVSWLSAAEAHHGHTAAAIGTTLTQQAESSQRDGERQARGDAVAARPARRRVFASSHSPSVRHVRSCFLFLFFFPFLLLRLRSMARQAT